MVRTGLRSIVSQPTRGHSKIDCVYVSDLDCSGVKVIISVAKSDHMAVVAYTGEMKGALQMLEWKMQEWKMRE